MEPSQTGALQPCVVFVVGNVNETCYCFFSACKCFLRDCENIWCKVVCWCNGNDLFLFRVSRQWSGTLRDLEWNNASGHASARVYLLSQCTTIRLRDLPPGGQIVSIIFLSFEIEWTALSSIQVMHFTRPHHMTWLRVIHSGSPASISDLLSWALSFVGIAEVSDSQIKVSRLSYAVIYLFFHPLQQLKSSLRYPGHWSWSILLIHSHSMEPFWTRALSLILLLWRNCWSVRFSEKWVVYRIGYLPLFFADFSTTLFFLSRV